MLDLEQLPEAWIAYNTGFCKAHGNLDPRSLERDGFPQPHDRGEQRADWWRSRGKHPQGIRRAYDLEQHLEAARMAAKRWPEKFTPCEVCGKAREPTSTNPLATYFSDHVTILQSPEQGATPRPHTPHRRAPTSSRRARSSRGAPTSGRRA